VKVPEILAPAGGFDALAAAVENGADAVYLGGKKFNARASADNFDDTGLERAVEYAHLRNTRIYVTVNTLIDNSEIRSVMEYIKFLYDLGVDGLIVQDLGLAYLVHLLFPRMRLHASTQMTIHNLEGIRFLERLGFHRIVLAREVSLSDISFFHAQSGLELEVFGHGALCVAYSGQCLMSSLIGGRSGNRGRCAQPCRMTYTLVDKKGNNVGGEGGEVHLLSPRDLNTIEILPQFCAAGIASLKIEGRMKRPEYVATVVRIYRDALNRLRENPGEFHVSPEEQRQLGQIFNRDFTTGYLISNPGRDLMSFQRPNNRGVRLGRIEQVLASEQQAVVKLDEKLRVGDGVEIWVTKGGRQGFFIEQMILHGKQVEQAGKGDVVTIPVSGKPQVGDRIFKTHDAELIAKAQQAYLDSQRLVPLHMFFWARDGRPFSLTAEDDQGNKSSYRSAYIVEKARKHSSTEETVYSQLDRLGGTGFKIEKADIEIEEGLMLPASELNKARRFVVEQIRGSRLEQYHYPKLLWPQVEKQMKIELKLPPHKTNRLKISVSVSGHEGAKAALDAGADVIYMGGEVFRSLKQNPEKLIHTAQMVKDKGKELVFALPRIFHERDKTALCTKIKEAADAGISSILVGSIGGILLAEYAGWEKNLYADFGFNVFNNLTIKALARSGIKRVTLSPELTFAQINLMGIEGMETECIVHGALPLMVSEYCVLGAVMGGKKTGEVCSRPCRKRFYGLKDRMNYVFPVEVDQYCRMHVFNSKELCLIQDVDRFIDVVDVMRIEGKRYRPEVLFQIVQSYHQVRAALKNGAVGVPNLGQIQKMLEQLTGTGFTKGHYFRGVVD